MINQITIIGNLTEDPDLRYTKTSGKEVANFSIAVDRWMGKDQETETDFYDVTVWGELALNVAASLHKGDRVVVNGKIQLDAWTDKDGNNRRTLRITADEVSPSLRFATIKGIVRNKDAGGAGETEPGTEPFEAPDDDTKRLL